MSRAQPIPMDDPREDMAEAHYFHTVFEIADLMEVYGVESVMRDVQEAIAQRRRQVTNQQVFDLPF